MATGNFITKISLFECDTPEETKNCILTIINPTTIYVKICILYSLPYRELILFVRNEEESRAR